MTQAGESHTRPPPLAAQGGIGAGHCAGVALGARGESCRAGGAAGVGGGCCRTRGCGGFASCNIVDACDAWVCYSHSKQF